MPSAGFLCIALLLVMFSASKMQAKGPARAPANDRVKQESAPKPAKPWHAVHLHNYNSDSDLDALGQNLGKLAEMGINVLILEIDYNFEFKSHPELRRGSNPITREGARKFAGICRKLGIRLIPEVQSLGHQAWKGENFPLLTPYP